MGPKKYIVKQGDTLNSISQGLGFKDYKEAGISSVPSGNFDLIRPGEEITIGNYPVQQDTTDMRIESLINNEKLNGILGKTIGTTENMAGTEGEQNGTGKVTVVRDQDNGDGTRTVTYSDGRTARVTATKNADGTDSYKEMTPEEGVNFDAQANISKTNAKGQKQLDSINSTLDSLGTTASDATKALIQNIKGTYKQKMSLMNDINERVLGAYEQVGNRYGKARYTAKLNEGILSDQEQKGIDKVAGLEAEMYSLILQAEQAQTKNDLELFNTRMTQLNTVTDNIQNEVMGIQKAANDSLTQMRENEKFQMDKDAKTQETAIKRAEVSAPALASSLSGFTTSEERSAFIVKFAEKIGIPVDILFGSLETYLGEKEKKDLDIENIRNTIKNRNTNTNIAEKNFAINKKKATFNPTEKERSLVGKWLTANGYGDRVDEIMGDSQAFYEALTQAEGSQL